MGIIETNVLSISGILVNDFGGLSQHVLLVYTNVLENSVWTYRVWDYNSNESNSFYAGISYQNRAHV